MKLRLLIASVFLLAITGSANATTQTVIVKNFSFTPANFTINLGDSILFKWQDGEHTTTSTTIPAGATAWDKHIADTAQTYIYVPITGGVYNYQCTPHASMGHIGKFTVNGPSDISEYTVAQNLFQIYPNPAQSVITLAFNNKTDASSAMIADISGKTILIVPLAKTQKSTFDVSALSNGVYFVRVRQDGKTYVRKFTISR